MMKQILSRLPHLRVTSSQSHRSLLSKRISHRLQGHRHVIPLSFYSTGPTLSIPKQKSSPTNIVLTLNAAKQIQNINQKQGKNQSLRVAVDPGGCHGFQYKFEMTNDYSEQDILLTLGDASIVIDETSLSMLRGSTLDFVQELIGSSFQITENPNSESACGCKMSFNIKV